MSKPNIFSETKHLKKWAINLANACGGQEVSQTSIKLNKHNIAQGDHLIIQFVVEFTLNMPQTKIKEKKEADRTDKQKT